MEKKAKALTVVYEDNSVETTTESGLLVMTEDAGKDIRVKLRIMNMDENMMSAVTADLVRICITEIGLDPMELLDYALSGDVQARQMEVDKEVLN